MVCVLPENATILLDTNFLMDLFNREDSYREFWGESTKKSVTLATTDLVRCEFLKSRTSDVVKRKAEFMARVVDVILPFDVVVGKFIQPTLEEYGSYSDGVSPIDILLACFIKRYKNLYFLTRNHKDFPTRIFDRSFVFSVEEPRDVNTYALYQYRPATSKITASVDEEIPF